MQVHTVFWTSSLPVTLCSPLSHQSSSSYQPASLLPSLPPLFFPLSLSLYFLEGGVYFVLSFRSMSSSSPPLQWGAVVAGWYTSWITNRKQREQTQNGTSLLEISKPDVSDIFSLARAHLLSLLLQSSTEEKVCDCPHHKEHLILNHCTGKGQASFVIDCCAGLNDECPT